MSKRYSHPRYQDPTLAYRRNQIAFRFSKVKKTFMPRELDLKVSQERMTQEELLEILSYYERLTVRHGFIYRIVNGPSVAILFGILSVCCFLLLAIDRNFVRNHPWIVGLILLGPVVIGAAVFACICIFKTKERKSRFQVAYKNFKEVSEELNTHFSFGKVFFDFDDVEKVLLIDFQTNDPIEVLKSKSQISQSQISIPISSTNSVSKAAPPFAPAMHEDPHPGNQMVQYQSFASNSYVADFYQENQLDRSAGRLVNGDFLRDPAPPSQDQPVFRYENFQFSYSHFDQTP